jgi:hypothetical protein
MAEPQKKKINILRKKKAPAAAEGDGSAAPAKALGGKIGKPATGKKTKASAKAETKPDEGTASNGNGKTVDIEAVIEAAVVAAVKPLVAAVKALSKEVKELKAHNTSLAEAGAENVVRCTTAVHDVLIQKTAETEEQYAEEALLANGHDITSYFAEEDGDEGNG